MARARNPYIHVSVLLQVRSKTDSWGGSRYAPFHLVDPSLRVRPFSCARRSAQIFGGLICFSSVHCACTRHALRTAAPVAHLTVCGPHVGWGPPVILFSHTQNYMYMCMYMSMCMRLSDRSHRTAGWVAAAHVHQMCTARLCGSHKNLSPSRPVVNWRSLNLYITLLRSQPRGAAIADRRHELGGALSAGAVAGEQCNRGIMRDRGIM